MGARALAVSVGHAYQARTLMDAGSPFPLLVDPGREVVRALGIRRSLGGLLDPRGWWNYLKSIVRGNRQGVISAAGVLQLPGLAILDARAEVLFVHRGRRLGDYPPLPRMLERLRTVAA